MMKDQMDSEVEEEEAVVEVEVVEEEDSVEVDAEEEEEDMEIEIITDQVTVEEKASILTYKTKKQNKNNKLDHTID